MKIVISGYGRMGHEVESAAIEREHHIITVVDNSKDWIVKEDLIKDADVIIDFSLPETAVEVFSRCFKLGIPIVSGTTGWYDNIEIVKNLCIDLNAAFFYAHNFSIGVNIFFQANKKLASMLNSVGGYTASIEETHHIHKLDSPSGTAIKAAEEVIEQFDTLSSWKNEVSNESSKLSIISKREGEVNGDHQITYESEVDIINISHSAKSRKGFALGAVIAAEFLLNKKGFYTMSDLLNHP